MLYIYQHAKMCAFLESVNGNVNGKSSTVNNNFFDFFLCYPVGLYYTSFTKCELYISVLIVLAS